MREFEELRRELRRAQTMNEALVDAGKWVVAERDALRRERDGLREALSFYAYPGSYENATPRTVRPIITDQGALARSALDGTPTTGISRGQHPEAVYPTERAEAS